MIEIKHLSISLVITVILSSVTPCNAINNREDFLTEPPHQVRERLIFRGIEAYKAGFYPEAVSLLRDFLNRHRLIQTPLEKEGLIYLALAYQQVGNSAQATAIINRAISLTNHTSSELASLEDTAGMIAQRQHQTQIAIAHWQKARQLYKNNHNYHKWADITLKIALSHQKLGNSRRYQELLSELKISKLDQ